jgi:hypothetical protein
MLQLGDEMTIEIAVKVHDGLVLAADSATTLLQRDSNGQTKETNIYNNANKVMNLYKGLPIGLMSWGLGSIGSSSISTLGKDLRQRLQGQDSNHADWAVDPTRYSIEEIATRVREFFYEENYLVSMPAGIPPVNPLGLLIGGYSSGGNQAEVFTLNADEKGCTAPTPTLTQEYGAVWSGQPEAITRLVLGVSGNLGQALINLQAKPEEVPAYVEAIKAQLEMQIVNGAMPIQDAIDLAEFLVDVTIKFVRFCPGSETVGGPIEVAAISKHEGFKWVKRKHYYSGVLNL